MAFFDGVFRRIYFVGHARVTEFQSVSVKDFVKFMVINFFYAIWLIEKKIYIYTYIYMKNIYIYYIYIYIYIFFMYV